MKAQIGVDAKTGNVHTLVTTGGNILDFLHGSKKMVFGDAGYRATDKRPENVGQNPLPRH